MPDARAILDALVPEDELQSTIERMLDWRRLLHFHDVDSRRNKAGLPDLIFPMPELATLHLWELKKQRGVMRAKQIEWGTALAACTRIDYRVVRPADLDAIRAYLGLEVLR